MSAGRIINLYDLADAAYDAKEIREMSGRLGHVAVIDRIRPSKRPAAGAHGVETLQALPGILGDSFFCRGKV